MVHSPLDPEVGIPPRELYKWTRVFGHEVRDVERGRATCTCGERQPRHELLARQRVGTRRALSGEERAEVLRAARGWRGMHLREAWPVLIERGEDEPLEELAERIEAALEEARHQREQLATDLATPEGEEMPVVGEEDDDAATRAAVLKRQHQEVCRQLAEAPWLRQNQTPTDEETIRWKIAALGDPLDEL